MFFLSLQGNAFPRLQQIARRILGIPASSAIVERLFSNAGFIINIRRTGLKPKSVDAHVFLYKHFVTARKRKIQEDDDERQRSEEAARLALANGDQT